MLAIAASDNTFSQADGPWRGKCIHCRRWLILEADGTPRSKATIEHIVPKNHGGDDSLENLALACAACNHEKGKRHDHKARGDARLQEIIEKLQAERIRRWRHPGVRTNPAASTPP